MRLTFQSVDGVKQIALTEVGGPHLISAGLEQKDWLSKEGTLAWLLWTLALVFHPAFGLELKCRLLLALEPAGFWTRIYTFCSPGSQACELGLELNQWLSGVSTWLTTALGTSHLRNCMNKFLIINLFLPSPTAPLTPKYPNTWVFPSSVYKPSRSVLFNKNMWATLSNLKFCHLKKKF